MEFNLAKAFVYIESSGKPEEENVPFLGLHGLFHTFATISELPSKGCVKKASPFVFYSYLSHF